MPRLIFSIGARSSRRRAAYPTIRAGADPHPADLEEHILVGAAGDHAASAMFTLGRM
jgi:hypothetical protein